MLKPPFLHHKAYMLPYVNGALQKLLDELKQM